MTYLEAGLPNITGTFAADQVDTTPPEMPGVYSGSFYFIEFFHSGDSGRTDIELAKIGFDASLCNSIYGNSKTVQPSAITVNYFICAR